MELEELRNLKKNILDKYVDSRDKSIRQALRRLDKLIKRKIKENESNDRNIN